MIPRGGEGIGHLATRIAVDLIPKAADAYMAADLGMLASLLNMVAQDYDRAADVLLADTQDIEAIFAAAGPLIEDDALRRRMAATMSARPEGMRVHQLAAQADAATRVLIDLHAHVESAEAAGCDWAASLNRTIWTFLDAHVARRRYDTAL